MTEIIKEGIHEGIPFADYLKWPGVSGSTLLKFEKSAKHARYEILHPSEPSSAMTLGSAVDMAILEPELFKETYVTMPDFEGHPNSNKFKEARAEWKDANTDKAHLTSEEMAHCTAMQQAIREHPTASELLWGTKGKNQVSITWQDRETGVQCKGRVDRLCKWKWPVILDLKTTRKIQPGKFAYDFGDFQYNVKMAIYQEALNIIAPAERVCMLVCVENTPPYDVAVHEIDSDALAHGARKFHKYLRQYAECTSTGIWPGVCPTTNMLTLPAKFEEHEITADDTEYMP